MTTTLWFVGIDVSKFRLDVATRPESERVSVRNDEAGVRELIQRLTCLRPHLVVLEQLAGLRHWWCLGWPLPRYPSWSQILGKFEISLAQRGN